MDRSSLDRHPTGSRSTASSRPTICARSTPSSTAAFADDPGDHPEPFDRWLEEHASNPSYDPTLWLLARDGNVPIAALTASAGDDGGWVDWLAVLPSHRGRGIGAALLRRSFATFAARGLRRVLVNVDAENVTGATAVYERVGMRVVNRWDLWERSSAAS